MSLHKALVLGVAAVLLGSVAACGILGPQRSPLAVAGGADAFLLAEGEGPGGPWSYWVWTSHCGLWQWVEYAPLRGGVGIDLEQCHGADTREQPYVVELSGVGDDGWAFVYGQTQLDVARVTVRTVDGREFEAETIAAPDELGWNARFWVMLIPDDSFDLTVRGYDASGQYVGGNTE